MVATSYGLGRHMVEVDPSKIPTLVKVRPLTLTFQRHSNTAPARHDLECFLLPLQLGREALPPLILL